MADTEDLINLSAREGNPRVNGVKVGEILAGNADDNAELRFVTQVTDKV